MSEEMKSASGIMLGYDVFVRDVFGRNTRRQRGRDTQQGHDTQQGRDTKGLE
jgi:hypothetical protein